MDHPYGTQASAENDIEDKRRAMTTDRQMQFRSFESSPQACELNAQNVEALEARVDALEHELYSVRLDAEDSRSALEDLLEGMRILTRKMKRSHSEFLTSLKGNDDEGIVIDCRGEGEGVGMSVVDPGTDGVGLSRSEDGDQIHEVQNAGNVAHQDANFKHPDHTSMGIVHRSRSWSGHNNSHGGDLPAPNRNRTSSNMSAVSVASSVHTYASEDDVRLSDLSSRLHGRAGADLLGLVHACMMVSDNAIFSSSEAAVLVEDARTATEQAKVSTEKKAKAERGIKRLYKENRQLRKELEQSRRERTVLVREVRELLRQRDDWEREEGQAERERMLTGLEDHIKVALEFHERQLSKPAVERKEYAKATEEDKVRPEREVGNLSEGGKENLDPDSNTQPTCKGIQSALDLVEVAKEDVITCEEAKKSGNNASSTEKGVIAEAHEKEVEGGTKTGAVRESGFGFGVLTPHLYKPSFMSKFSISKVPSTKVLGSDFAKSFSKVVAAPRSPVKCSETEKQAEIIQAEKTDATDPQLPGTPSTQTLGEYKPLHFRLDEAINSFDSESTHEEEGSAQTARSEIKSMFHLSGSGASQARQQHSSLLSIDDSTEVEAPSSSSALSHDLDSPASSITETITTKKPCRRFKDITLHRGAGSSFGFTMEDRKGRGGGIFVKRMKAGGIAAAEGSLCVGDKIESVNGKSIRGWSSDRVAVAVRETPPNDSLRLFVSRLPSPEEMVTPATPTLPIFDEEVVFSPSMDSSADTAFASTTSAPLVSPRMASLHTADDIQDGRACTQVTFDKRNGLRHARFPEEHFTPTRQSSADEMEEYCVTSPHERDRFLASLAVPRTLPPKVFRTSPSQLISPGAMSLLSSPSPITGQASESEMIQTQDAMAPPLPTLSPGETRII